MTWNLRHGGLTHLLGAHDCLGEATGVLCEVRRDGTTYNSIITTTSYNSKFKVSRKYFY